MLTGKPISDGQYGQLSRRIDELKERVKKGAVPFKEAMDGVQEVMEHAHPFYMAITRRMAAVSSRLRDWQSFNLPDLFRLIAGEKGEGSCNWDRITPEHLEKWGGIIWACVDEMRLNYTSRPDGDPYKAYFADCWVAIDVAKTVEEQIRALGSLAVAVECK